MRLPVDLIDDVEIVEPPLEELSKKPSIIKRTCLTGCGCIVIFIIAIIILIRIFLGNGPQVVKSLPDYFPKSIPVYDQDNIEKITLTPEKYEERSVELALVFPKIILAPLQGKNSTSTSKNILENQISAVQKIWQALKRENETYATHIQIEWTNIEAEPTFIFAYYQDHLTKNGYQVNIQENSETNPQFSFSKNMVTGFFKAQKGIDQKNTPYAILKITLPYSYTELASTPPNESLPLNEFHETSTPSL